MSYLLYEHIAMYDSAVICCLIQLLEYAFNSKLDSTL